MINNTTWMALALAASFTATTLAASFTATAVAQGIRDGNLVVENGQVLQLNPGRVGYFVERVTLGDGSRIIAPAATRAFVLHANQVNVGNDTAILARGRDGAGARENERDGPTIVLIFRSLERVQGLHIASVGGDGVPGKDGERGANGRPGSCSGGLAPGRPGGNGRDGARGGDAGDGGRIFLVLPEGASGYGISMNTAAGEPGRGGAGGPAGQGGRGKVCWNFPKLKVSAGGKGNPGWAGAEGEPGSLGQFRTFTFNDSRPGASIEDRLRSIVAILRGGGYAGDAEALKAVLGPQGLYRQQE